MENEFNNELGFGMQPMGIATLAPEPVFIPDARILAQNIIKQKALDTIGRKVGLPALGSPTFKHIRSFSFRASGFRNWCFTKCK